MEKFRNADPFIDLALLLGGCSALAASIVGYMLSMEGGYSEDAVSLHQWMGIALTIVSFLFFVLRKIYVGHPKIQQIGFIIILILVTLTGHFGGNLTHGSTYLVQYAPNPIRAIAGLPPKIKRIYKTINHIDSALVFEDILMPILDKRCISCHNEEKLKGELLLTSYSEMMKGGESGKAIVAGKSNSSELYQRITLAHDDEDFMPPEGKTPLSKQEVKFMEWWIDAGAKPNSSLNVLNANTEIRNSFEKYLGIGKYNTLLNDPIDPVKSSVIKAIQAAGFNVSVLAEDVNYLDVSIMNREKVTKKDLQSLNKAKEHIVYLDLKNSGLKDEMIDELNDFPNLLKLRLDRNDITDVGVEKLRNMSNLKYINLSFTKITDVGLATVRQLENIEKVYFYRSNAEGSKDLN